MRPPPSQFPIAVPCGSGDRSAGERVRSKSCTDDPALGFGGAPERIVGRAERRAQIERALADLADRKRTFSPPCRGLATDDLLREREAETC